MKKIHNENSRSEYFTFKPLFPMAIEKKNAYAYKRRRLYACAYKQEGKQIY